MGQIFKGEEQIPVTIVEVTENTLELSFAVDQILKVSGTSKGKGFQGVVKRWGFHGGPKTHGQKDRHRAPGSIGAITPQRVLKGKKMAGRMGNNRVTLRDRKIVGVQNEGKVLLIKGALPGHKGSEYELREMTN